MKDVSSAERPRSIQLFPSYFRLSLGLFAACLALASAFTISAIIGSKGEQEIERDARRLLQSVASQLAERIDSSIYERYGNITQLSLLEALNNPRHPLAEKRKLLERLKQTFSEYAWIGIADPRGRVLVSTGGLLEGADVRKRPWFIEGLKAPWIGDAHEAVMLAKFVAYDATTTSEPARFIDVTAPLVDHAGRTVAVLGAHVSVAWARDLGRHLADSFGESAAVGITILTEDHAVVLSTRSAAAANEPLLTATARTTGTRGLKGLGWSILVSQPEHVAFAGARHMEHQVIWFGALLGTLFALAGLVIGNRIERALVAAKETAEDATRAKSIFLARMSHEIRTPINAVIGLSQMLIDAHLGGEPESFARTIHRSTLNLLDIINDILDFSKIEAGKMTLEEVDFRPQELVDDVMSVLLLSAKQKGLWLKREVAPDVPEYLRGDVGRLRQMIMNLVSNAVKFTSTGGVTIRLRVQLLEANALRLEVEIEDTGLGIGEDGLRRLFADYTQADTSTSRKFGGTGLGLSICKSFAELMNGEIGVTSQEGSGSKFWFRVQLKSGTPKPAAYSAVRGSRDARVLIVEDDPTNLLITSRMLEKAGYQVLTARTGAEAIRIASADRGIELVLMDCHMPEMDGFEATRRLRAAGNHVPIVALTGVTDPDEIAACHACGMNGHLVKPTSLGRMIDTIETHISRSLRKAS